MEALATDLGIAESVTDWGPQLEVEPFFSAADTSIMSPKSEGLPISPVRRGGMAEVVNLAKAGITVSATNPAEMAAAILRLVGSEKESGSSSQRTRRHRSSHASLLRQCLMPTPTSVGIRGEARATGAGVQKADF